MKQTNQRQLGLVISGAFLLLAFYPMPTAVAITPAAKLNFGMDVGSVDALTNAGVKPDYAVMWAGVWLQSSGWSGVNGQLDALYAKNVVPAIHFYYWGNDISRACIENGCWSTTHNAWKDKGGWQRLADALAASLNGHVKGRPAVIILETEFNKNDAATYEPLDGYLADKANYFHSAYPASIVVLGFGNWGASNWGIFDRAAAASNLEGIQGMRGSTRDTTSSYLGVVTSVLDATKTLVAKFGKGVLVTDIALSSYTEPNWLSTQRATLKSMMDRRTDYRNAGAVGIIYRGMYDAANANTNDWYGEGERHFGLAWAANKTWKPAMGAWANGVKAERGVAPGGVFEGEAFAQKSTGGLAKSSAASGGAFWNLWSNGYAATPMQTGAGSYRLTVHAGGSAAAGIGPTMKIEIDGISVFQGTVTAGSFHDYVVTRSLSAGSHSVRVSFLNDGKTSTEDRNLWLDRATLTQAV